MSHSSPELVPSLRLLFNRHLLSAFVPPAAEAIRAAARAAARAA